MKYLQSLKYMFVFSAVLLLMSCSKDDEIIPADELQNLQLVTTISNDQHRIELYTGNGKFQTGFNDVFFQIKNADGSTVNNATASWVPLMQMMNMAHSCPYSDISKKENAQSTYKGFIVFQMAGNNMEHWSLTLNYNIGSNSFTANGPIEVTTAPLRVVESFEANNNKRYVLAMVEPTHPIVGSNDIQAVIYQMETMMHFVPAANYTLKIDPRMPGMGNHSSPNNLHLTQASAGMYRGKVSLTMTGYWKINLQLFDDMENPLKGEEVTDMNEDSSIYFEIEF